MINGKRVLAAVSEASGISEAEILCEKRKPKLVAARQVVSWILRTDYGWTLCEVGELLNRDHTTILNQLRKFGEVFSKRGELKKREARVLRWHRDTVDMLNAPQSSQNRPGGR